MLAKQHATQLLDLTSSIARQAALLGSHGLQTRGLAPDFESLESLEFET